MPAKRKELYACPVCQGSTTIYGCKKVTSEKHGIMVLRRHYCQKCDMIATVLYSGGYAKLVDTYHPHKRLKIEEVLS